MLKLKLCKTTVYIILLFQAVLDKKNNIIIGGVWFSGLEGLQLLGQL